MRFVLPKVAPPPAERSRARIAGVEGVAPNAVSISTIPRGTCAPEPFAIAAQPNTGLPCEVVVHCAG